MARQSAGALIPGLSLTRAGGEAISAQLFRGLRELVISGQLEPGARLPSTRVFASDLGVSRTTVAQAYDQLKSEGYLCGREKSGTFVPDVLPVALAWRGRDLAATESTADPAIGLADRTAGTAQPRAERGAVAHPFHPGSRPSARSRSALSRACSGRCRST
jgi:GntR family transcriptional regulator/MocR family aminotransferase